jgi:hypothetical protein
MMYSPPGANQMEDIRAQYQKKMQNPQQPDPTKAVALQNAIQGPPAQFGGAAGGPQQNPMASGGLGGGQFPQGIAAPANPGMLQRTQTPAAQGGLGAWGNKLEGFDAQKMASGHDSPKYQFGRVFSNFDPKGGLTQGMLDQLNGLGLGQVSGTLGGDKIKINNADPRFNGVTEFDFIRDLEQGGGFQWNGLNQNADMGTYQPKPQLPWNFQGPGFPGGGGPQIGIDFPYEYSVDRSGRPGPDDFQMGTGFPGGPPLETGFQNNLGPDQQALMQALMNDPAMWEQLVQNTEHLRSWPNGLPRY